MFLEGLFRVFASSAAAAGLVVIGAANPVHSVLALVVCFACCSGLLLLVQAEFVALLLLVVYVGAIAVLFLFVVMMLDVAVVEGHPERPFALPLMVARFVLFMAQGYSTLVSGWGGDLALAGGTAVGVQHTPWAGLTTMGEPLAALGKALYVRHAMHFLVAGLVLLVAMLGAISLTLGRRKKWKVVKQQLVWEQMGRDAVRDQSVRRVQSGGGSVMIAQHDLHNQLYGYNVIRRYYADKYRRMNPIRAMFEDQKRIANETQDAEAYWAHVKA